MNGLGSGYYFIMHDSIHGYDRRRTDEWRRLHQRPDAPPLPPEAPKEGLVARVAGRLPVVRRVVAGRA